LAGFAEIVIVIAWEPSIQDITLNSDIALPEVRSELRMAKNCIVDVSAGKFLPFSFVVEHENTGFVVGINYVAA
jgi:hypothetical protein